jgi:hypothetical protein
MKRLGEATTIAIVATDAALDKAALTRLATAAQDGMARAIVPSHTPFDGDLVFAVSTGARALPDPAMTTLCAGPCGGLRAGPRHRARRSMPPARARRSATLLANPLRQKPFVLTLVRRQAAGSHPPQQS